MSNWYALQVRSRFGKTVSTALRAKGYEEFLPVYRTVRQSRGGGGDLELPLFPGYLFCRLDPSERLLPVLTIPGVMRIVSVGKILLPVTDDEIEAVKAVSQCGLPAEPWPFLGTGCRVSLERGPLSGLEGMVISVDGAQRLVVSVSLLQRSIAVKIERSWVRCMSRHN
jgi:transcription antitermination factor NusG